MNKLVFTKFKGNNAYYRDGFKRKKCHRDKIPFYIQRGELFIFNKDGEAILLREESINRFKDINARWIYGILSLITIASLVLTIVFIIFPLNFNMVYKNNFGSKKFLEEGQQFLDIRANIKNIQSYKEIANFYIRKDTFQFKNISTDSSPLGNCFGIAYTEKYLFLQTLKNNVDDKENKLGYDISSVNKKIGDYKLDLNNIEILYGPADDNTIDSREKFNDILRAGYNPKDYQLKDIYTLLFGKETTTFNNIDNKEIKELLKTISYYQNEYFKITPKVEFLPYVLSSRLDAADNMIYYYWKKIKDFLGIDKYNIEKDIDIRYITDMIDENKPAIVTVFGNKSGHAILAYGYEWIRDNFLKIYVQDSNIPLFNDEEKFKNINDDIINNSYILFKKKNGRWYYKYDPYINEKFVYSHRYNSYIPNGYIKVY